MIDNRELTLKELKKTQLDMMEYVHHWCEINNITYFLMYGSLLGAVRHKGYIPWDDDIDIAMPRGDYEKFFSLFNKDNDSDYEAVSIDTNPEYYLALGKIIDRNTCLVEEVKGGIEIGVFIDVFPLDCVPESKQFWNTYREIGILRRLLGFKQAIWTKERSMIKNVIIYIIQILLTFVSVRFLCKRINLLASRFNDLDGNTYIGSLVLGVYKTKEIWPKEYFENVIGMSFENLVLNSPKNYDDVLRNVYGDYMQIPPLEKRKGHHKFKAWKR